MPTAEVLPNDDDLRSWDWVSEVKAQGRMLTWVARQTGKAQTTVYAYAYGHNKPPIEWLRAVAALLGKEAAA